MKTWIGGVGVAWLTSLLSPVAAAQVPEDIYTELQKLGRVVAGDETARLYRPFFRADWMRGVTAVKDIAYGADPKQILDVYTHSNGGGPRPVLIFLPGGQGIKQMRGAAGEPFYGNVGVWGVRHGMIVVVGQYRSGPGQSWDAGARDVGLLIAWVKANIAAHGGDSTRVTVMGHSNGSAQVANYLAHTDLQNPGGPGVRGAVLIGGAFNLLPLRTPSPDRFSGAGGPDVAPPPILGAPLPPPAPPLDPAVLKQRSDLEGLKAQQIPIMLVAAELDPEEIVETAQLLGGELRKAGRKPTTLMVPRHSHISEITSFGTSDESVSGPVLRFLRKSF